MKSVLVAEYDIVSCDQSRKLTGQASKTINSAELPDFNYVSVFVWEASFFSSRLMSLSDARIAWLFVCHAFLSLPIATDFHHIIGISLRSFNFHNENSDENWLPSFDSSIVLQLLAFQIMSCEGD